MIFEHITALHATLHGLAMNTLKIELFCGLMTLSEAWAVLSISKIFVAGCINKDAFSKHSLFNHQCLKTLSDSLPRCLALVHLFWIWVKWKGYVSANWTDIFQKVLSSNLLYLVEFHDHVLVQAAIGFKHIFAMINLEIMNFHNTTWHYPFR